MEIVAQILGIIAIIVSVLSMVFNKKTLILLLSFVYNILTLLSYLLLGKYLGCILVGVLTLKSLIYFIFAKKNKKPNILILIIFEISILTLSIVLWQDWFDIFILVNSLINTYFTWQDNVVSLKIAVVVCSILLILYDIFAGAYVYVISEFLYGLTSLITLLIMIKNGELKDERIRDEQIGK